MLDQAHAGTLPGMVRTGVTFADACAEYLRYVEHDRDRKPSTLRDYRSSDPRAPRAGVRRRCGSRTSPPDRIEAWKATLRVGNRTKNKLLTVLNGVLDARAARARAAPQPDGRRREAARTARRAAIEVFSPEEVWALVRAAESEQDAAIYLTAAFTGLRRGELVALRWRDVDFAARASACAAQLRRRAPDDAEERQGPLGADGARRRRGAGAARRAASAGPATTTSSSPASPAATSMPRRSSALPRGARARRAAPLRFHDLRHTFGTRMIAKADIRRVQEWMGHADVPTTMRYLHYVERPDEAELVAAAFAVVAARRVSVSAARRGS